MAGFFPHVFGQEKVSRELKRLFEENRLPHTLIFYGDEGLGKTTAALDLAGILTGKAEKLEKELSEISEEERQEMPVLTLADEQVWYLHPVGMELKIEQFRTFLSAMSSFDEKPHVCIIDEAQTMMDPVANALLKTLEEPEGNIHFILITHDLDALLPTIISRGERFGFLPLGAADYFSFIRSRKDIHFPRGMDEKVLFQLSEGNPGITLEVAGDGISTQPESAMDFWETVTGGDTPFSTLSSMEFKERKDFLKMLRWILLVGRDIFILAETGNSSALRCVTVAAREERISPFWQGEKGEAALQALKTAETAVARYINIKNIWDMILITFEHIQKGEKEWIR